MRVSCTICKDFFIPHSHVHVLNCGHLYHDQCIDQWLKTSYSCPQCRAKLRSPPFRIFFNIEDEVSLDPDTLQNKLDKVLYEQQLNSVKIQKLETELSLSTTQNTSLRELLKEAEKGRESVKQENYGLKSELKLYIRKTEQIETYRKKLEDLESKISNYKALDQIIKGTQAEVREVLKEVPCEPASIKRLTTYVEALKSKSEAINSNFRDLKKSYVKLQDKHTEITRSKAALVSQFQELQKQLLAKESVLPAMAAVSELGATTSQEEATVAAETKMDSSYVGLPVPRKVVDLRKNGPSPRFKSMLPNWRFEDNVRSKNFHYDGMGGSKKESLVKPLTRDEFAELQLRKKLKTAPSKENKPSKVFLKQAPGSYVDL